MKAGNICLQMGLHEILSKSTSPLTAKSFLNRIIRLVDPKTNAHKKQFYGIHKRKLFPVLVGSVVAGFILQLNVYQIIILHPSYACSNNSLRWYIINWQNWFSMGRPYHREQGLCVITDQLNKWISFLAKLLCSNSYSAWPVLFWW